jgi:hypothetical protein
MPGAVNETPLAMAIWKGIERKMERSREDAGVASCGADTSTDVILTWDMEDSK